MPCNSKPKYSYSPHHGMWRVYRNEYTKNTCTGEPIEEYRTKEEARKREAEIARIRAEERAHVEE